MASSAGRVKGGWPGGALIVLRRVLPAVLSRAYHPTRGDCTDGRAVVRMWLRTHIASRRDATMACRTAGLRTRRGT